ncbi:MAG: hypothetical protein N2112_11595 [Gemmataceae bacterium]|nr:hypothetical protein [Gemmataceae bacterium]
MTRTEPNPKRSPIHCQHRIAVSVMALIIAPLIILGLVGLSLWLLVNVAVQWSIPISIVLVTGAYFFAQQLSHTYDWVEIEGDMIRGRKFWSRRLIERPLNQIIQVIPLKAIDSDSLENQVIDRLYKTTNRGYEIRFADGTKFFLIRGDMWGIDEFMNELAKSMP